MSVSLVLTVIGDDRPGLVRSLSRAVAEHDGSWQESQMARMAGKFAGILRAEVAQERSSALEAALRELSTDGLQIVIESGDQEDSAGVAVQIVLVGSDRPGIVRELSGALGEGGINIEEIRTGTAEAPMSGGRLFTATLSVRLPTGVSTKHLRETLEGVANEIMVDIDISDGPTAA